MFLSQIYCHVIHGSNPPRLITNVMFVGVSMNFGSIDSSSSFSWTQSPCCSLNDETVHSTSSLLYTHSAFYHFIVPVFAFWRMENKTVAVFVQQVASGAVDIQYVWFLSLQLLRRQRRPTDLWRNKCPLPTSNAKTNQRKWVSDFISIQTTLLSGACRGKPGRVHCFGLLIQCQEAAQTNVL